MSRYSLVTSITMIILAMSLSLMLTTDISLAQGLSNSHAFKGKFVNAMGQPAKDGIEIRALIDGNVVAKGISGNGQYKLSVAQPPGASFSGKTITFTGGRFNIKESAQWLSGATTVLDLKNTKTPTALNQVRGAIAGVIDPNNNTRQTAPPNSPNQNKSQIERQINQQKNQRLLQLDQRLELEIAKIEEESQQQRSQRTFDYENHIKNLERERNSPNSDRESQMREHELNSVQSQYEQDKQRNASSRHLEDLERNIIRLKSVLMQSKARHSQSTIRLISNQRQEYDRSITELTMMYNEQKNRIKQEIAREKGNIEREYSQMLREQLEHISRQTMEQDRRAREEQLNEERYKQGEDRMKREMEMQDERMHREMEMNEQRMRMEEDRMRRSGQTMDRGQNMNQGQGMDRRPDPSQRIASGEPKRTRGFLMNPKPGMQVGGFNATMDPTMLTIIGIALTVLTTGLTLFRSN